MAERMIRPPDTEAGGLPDQEDFGQHQLDGVAQMLFGGDNAPETPVEAEPEAEGPEPEQDETDVTDDSEQPEGAVDELSIKTLAEKAGVSVDDVFNAIKITVGEQSMSLGEVTDRLQDVVNADEVVAKAETRRAEVGQDIMRQNREVQAMLARIGHQPTEQDKQAAEDAWNQYTQTQDALLLSSIPEWEDSKARQQDISAYTSMLKDYGLNEAEIAQMQDARLVMLFNDHARLKARVENAQKQVANVKRNQKPSGKRKTPSSTIDNVRRDFAAGKISQDQMVLAELVNGVQANGIDESGRP